MTYESQRDQFATRRCVLLGAGLLGAVGAGAVLTGCSTAAVPYDANELGQAPGTEPTSAAPPTAGVAGGTTGGGAAHGSAASGSSTGGHSGTLLGSAADIPVGGGVVFTSAQVVVTQPAKGAFKAFSAVCTHVGCLCNQVADGTINCPCHGSKFKITNGAVVTGPASAPLPAKTIKVTGGKVYLT